MVLEADILGILLGESPALHALVQAEADVDKAKAELRFARVLFLFAEHLNRLTVAESVRTDSSGQLSVLRSLVALVGAKDSRIILREQEYNHGEFLLSYRSIHKMLKI